MAKKAASIRYDEDKLKLAIEKTGQPSLQKVVNFFFDEVWRKHNPPLLDISEIKNNLKYVEEPSIAKEVLQDLIADVKPSGLKFKNEPKTEKFPSKEAVAANEPENREINQPDILKQIAAIEAEKIPKERDTIIGRRSWYNDQQRRIKELKDKLL